MLRIIDGKRYNTETATLVLDLPCDYSRSDFKFEDTQLHLTKKGVWFLAGVGNAMSRWSTHNGNMYGPGGGIQPITADEARSILEGHAETDLVEQYFGDKIVDA